MGLCHNICVGVWTAWRLVLSFHHVASGDQTWLVMIWQQVPLPARPSSRPPQRLFLTCSLMFSFVDIFSMFICPEISLWHILFMNFKKWIKAKCWTETKLILITTGDIQRILVMLLWVSKIQMSAFYKKCAQTAPGPGGCIALCHLIHCRFKRSPAGCLYSHWSPSSWTFAVFLVT